MRAAIARLAKLLPCLASMAHACAGGVAHADMLSANGFHGEEEAMLVAALGDIREARLDRALENLERLVERHPNFRLAQLVYGDILLAKRQAIAGFGAIEGVQEGVIAGLRDEARMRLKHYLAAPPPGHVPAALIELSDRQRRAVVVDIDSSRMYLFEHRGGALELASSFYVSTGKKGPRKLREGDQRTPIGVYFITGRIPSAELPDFYGTGAFPVNYPNEWDLRLGRTGYGIWIHGVPSDTYSRAPRASDGCVALSNEDLALIWDSLPAGDTPVLFQDRIEWVDEEAREAAKRAMLERLEAWRKDWESLDTSRYMRHYSRHFHSEAKDYDAWRRHKKRVNSHKSYVDLSLSNISMLGYPGEPDLVVVSFDQDYHSSNFSSQSAKRQYWKKESDGAWRILYEGTVHLRPEHIRGVPYSARSSLTRRDTIN